MKKMPKIAAKDNGEIEKRIIEDDANISKERKNKLAEEIYKLFDCKARKKDIVSTFPKTKNIEEFLRNSKVNLDIFPQDYKRGSLEEAARLIYGKTRDKVTIKDYTSLIIKNSNVVEAGEEIEIGRLFYVGKVCARLERANIQYLSFNQLNKVYKILPKYDKVAAFRAFKNWGKSPAQFWGSDYLDNISLGKLEISEKVISNEEGSLVKVVNKNWKAQIDDFQFNLKVPAYELVVKLGKPWADSIYMATNYLAEHVKK